MSTSHFIHPLSSAKLINKLANHVKINGDKVNILSDKLIKSMATTDYGLNNWSQYELHPKEANDNAIEWIFLVDSLNFSFWTPKNQPQFTVDYHGKSYTGYWSLCAAINKALESGTPLSDPNYYSLISEDKMREVFKGKDGTNIPLLKERMDILHENGKILLNKFDGQFMNCIIQSNSSAQTLLKLLVDTFPSFRDQAVYKGHQVSFYKRAQILIADIWACFKGKDIGYFQDIDTLTMFADYRVPQVLEYFGVLEYDQELKDILSSDLVLDSGSEFEVEIRGQSIYAVDLIAKAMKEKLSETGTKINVPINSILIDFYLWDFRRQHVDEIDNNANNYHKVRCIYY